MALIIWILNWVHQYVLTWQGMHDIRLRCGHALQGIEAEKWTFRGHKWISVIVLNHCLATPVTGTKAICKLHCFSALSTCLWWAGSSSCAAGAADCREWCTLVSGLGDSWDYWVSHLWKYLSIPFLFVICCILVKRKKLRISAPHAVNTEVP